MKRCGKCKAVLPDSRSYCPDPWCPGGKDDLEVIPEPRGMVEFKCPHCGAEVIYVGATPAALECPTPSCPNYKLR